MNKNILFLAIFFLFAMAVYFITNPSYEKSLEAKYYFEIGDYEESYTLAKEAFSYDVYNKMASTIMTQSQLALKYVKYINDSKKYINDIEKIVSKDEITQADKAKIKIICEIMVDRYKKLVPSVITDEELIKTALKYHDKFRKLLEKVDK